MTDVTMQFREHHVYGTGWTPEITFSNPSAGHVKIDSSYLSVCHGHMFITFPKDFLNGKKIKYTRAYTSNKSTSTLFARILDGAYDRTSNTDFPTGSDVYLKGSGNLYTIENNTAGTATITSPALDLSASVLQEVTFIVSVIDAWTANSMNADFSLFQVLNGDDSVNTTFPLGTITMEVTGTYGDYGYGDIVTIPWTGFFSSELEQPYGTDLSGFSELIQEWGLLDDPAYGTLIQPWLIAESVGFFVFEQPWGLEVSRAFIQPWRDAYSSVGGLSQLWGNARFSHNTLIQPWRNAYSSEGTLVQPWQVYGPVDRAELEQVYPILDGPVQSLGLEQTYGISGYDAPASASLTQVWSICGGVVSSSSSVSVSVKGIDISSAVAYLELIRGSFELSVASIGIIDFRQVSTQARKGDVVTLVIAGVEYVMIATDYAVDLDTGEARLEVTAKAVLLSQPFDVPAAREWPNGGSAKSIIAELVDGEFVTEWDGIDDWPIQPNVLSGSVDDSRMDIIRQVINNRAVMECTPSGGLKFTKEYPASPTVWPHIAPQVGVPAQLVLSSSSRFDRRGLTNAVLITDGALDGAEYTIDVSGDGLSRMIRVMRYPWDPLFEIKNASGLAMVYNGVVRHEVVEESVRIIDGYGQLRFPPDEVLTVAWSKDNLGAVSVMSGTEIQSSVFGNSLLTISYVTKCKEWAVESPETQDVLFYVKELTV